MSTLKLFNETITNPRTQSYLTQVLAEKKSAFVNNITALVANNVNLQACEPMSLMYAGIKATALDLPLDANLGFAYVIPYKDNKAGKTVAQFQLGYRGFIQLAIRSGQFKTINVEVVKEGELKNWDMLSGEIAFEPASDRETRKTIGYVAFFRLTNGFEKTLYMTVEKMEAHASQYSQSYGSKYEKTKATSKWTTDFDAMAKKTVLKLLLSKFAPLSVQMQSAIANDQAVFDQDGKPQYVDNAHSVEDAVAEEIQQEAGQETLAMPEEDANDEQPSTEEIDDNKPPF